MQADPQIIPAILATTEEEYKKKLSGISTALRSPDQFMQIDIMDGKFVPNKSVGLDVIRKYPTILQREVHLMVSDPSMWVKELIALGIGRFVIHLEVGEGEIRAACNTIRGAVKGATIILAFNPETPVAKYKEYEPFVDGILIMSVPPGFSGQEFIPSSIEKVKKAREYIAPHHFIEVDGGIDEKSAKLLSEAGANYLVIGESLTDGNITQNLEKIRQSLRD